MAANCFSRDRFKGMLVKRGLAKQPQTHQKVLLTLNHLEAEAAQSPPPTPPRV